MYNSVSLTALALAAALSFQADAQTADIDAAIEAARAEVMRPGFSGAVVVLQGGEPIYEAYEGLADQAAGREIGEQTRFNIASIGKFLTAVGYRSVAEANGVDDFAAVRPAEILADYPGLFDPELTVADLMRHSTTAESFFQAADGENRSVAAQDNRDIFEILADAQDGPIGPRHDGLQYNNSNAIVTAQIMAHFSGLTYEEAMQAYVFGPAGAASALFARLSQADELDLV